MKRVVILSSNFHSADKDTHKPVCTHAHTSDKSLYLSTLILRVKTVQSSIVQLTVNLCVIVKVPRGIRGETERKRLSKGQSLLSTVKLKQTSLHHRAMGLTLSLPVPSHKKLHSLLIQNVDWRFGLAEFCEISLEMLVGNSGMFAQSRACD